MSKYEEKRTVCLHSSELNGTVSAILYFDKLQLLFTNYNIISKIPFHSKRHFIESKKKIYRPPLCCFFFSRCLNSLAMMAKSCEWRISRTYLLEKYSHLQIVNSTYKIDLLPCRMFSPVKIFTATHRGGHQLRKRALRHLLSLVISLTSLALSVNDSTQPGSWLGCMSKSLIKHVKRNASPTKEHVVIKWNQSDARVLIHKIISRTFKNNNTF